MSYEHLAGRIVEIQRSMVGRPAITIAQSTDGLVVTDDGNVESIEGDPCTVLDELVEGYTEMLGDPAASRFRTAATEFRGELELPDSLAAPDESVREDATESDDATSTDDEDDATAIEISSPREGETADEDDGDEAIDGSVMVQYTIQNRSAGQVTDADLDSVYLLTEDEHDWKAPVTVAEAITSAVTSASGVEREDLGDIEEYVQSDRVLSTLYAESQAPVSFEVRDLKVTLYSNGTVRVRGQ